MIGKKIGNRYEILALIGGGGMSLVYQAKDIFLNRIVALKVLREQFTSDIDFVRRFRREAQAVASLSHPNIVSIYDVGQENQIHYLVMEYIKGITLKQLINENGKLSIKEAVDIAKQICDALEHAHEQEIIHRDIKPHNILITRGGRVKVTDFGIARAVSTATVTHTKGIIGSVHYFSPEQAKGEITGEKSDIYSLGIVLYEMLTGRLPFEAESPIGVALQHIQTAPIPPSQINPAISSQLESIILKAVQKKPDERYENVSQLRLDLINALLDKNVNLSSEEFLVKEPLQSLQKTNINEDTLVFEDLNEPLANEKKTRKIKPIPAIIIGILGFLILGIILWGAGKLFIKNEIEVPELVNLNTTEAQEILNSKGLKLVISKKISNSEIEEGKIISQDPLPGTKSKTGRAINVVVSSGPTLVTVPPVIGSSEIIADVYITNAGLVVGEVSRDYSSEYPVGTIISQAPEAGEKVPEKTKIDLVISKGTKPQYITMPSLIGSHLSNVKVRLQELGLELGEVTERRSELYPEDFVIEQSPTPKKEIFQGSPVDLVISNGPGPTTQQVLVDVRLSEAGEVKIEVRDARGERVAYQKYHEQGDVFTKMVNYYGQGVITVYIDGKQYRQKIVPAEQ